MGYSNLVSGFTKLFGTIIHSTIWREDMHIKVVWVTMLAMADRNGRVFASVPGLADAARVSLPQCLDALEKLSSPDHFSRTKDFEGKRIAECDGGWQLLNYQKYRELRDSEERRIQTREAVRRHRKAKSITVSRGKQRKPRQAQAEAEAEAEKSPLVPAGTAEEVDLDLDTKITGKEIHAFLQRFCELYSKHRHGAKFHIQREKHVPIARALLQIYDLRRLEKLITVLLTTDDEWVAKTDRGIGILSVKVSWLDGLLAEYEAKHGVIAS